MSNAAKDRNKTKKIRELPSDSQIFKNFLRVGKVLFYIPAIFLTVRAGLEYEKYLNGDNSMIPDILEFGMSISLYFVFIVVLTSFISLKAFNYWKENKNTFSGTIALISAITYNITLLTMAIFLWVVLIFLLFPPKDGIDIPDPQDSAPTPSSITILIDDFSDDELDLLKWYENKCGSQYWQYDIGSPKITLFDHEDKECWLIPLPDKIANINKIEVDFIHEFSYKLGSFASIMTTCGSEEIYFEFDAKKLYSRRGEKDRKEISPLPWTNETFYITLIIEWTTDNHVNLSAFDTTTGEKITNEQLECSQSPREIKIGAIGKGYSAIIYIDKVEIEGNN